MRKVKIGLLVVLVILMGGLAVITRLSFTDHYNQVSYREKLVVPYLPEGLQELCAGQYNILAESPIIITGRATGDYEYVYGNLWQEVEVQGVIRGKDRIDSGDMVKIVGSGRIVGEVTSGEYKGMMYADTSFLNYMEKDDRYLIFINNRIHASYEDDKVYQVNKNATTLQYINITDDTSRICNVKDSDGPSDMLYSCFKDYEFATNSEEVLQSLEETKNRLIEKFVAADYY
ncbi:MAG: hypothetical protein LUH14_09620 [Clostridiaceae bacterium]|nr:hypothetical protein [Clostridiaceae bacterium]